MLFTRPAIMIKIPNGRLVTLSKIVNVLVVSQAKISTCLIKFLNICVQVRKNYNKRIRYDKCYWNHKHINMFIRDPRVYVAVVAWTSKIKMSLRRVDLKLACWFSDWFSYETSSISSGMNLADIKCFKVYAIQVYLFYINLISLRNWLVASR